MNTIKQITELSPLCAALIAMLEDMAKEDNLPTSTAFSTAVAAYSRIEEMRVAAKIIPTGLRQDMAYEMISHYSSALTNVMSIYDRRLTRQSVKTDAEGLLELQAKLTLAPLKPEAEQAWPFFVPAATQAQHVTH